MRHNEQGFVTLILLAVLALVAAGGAYIAHGGNHGGRSRQAPVQMPPPGGPVTPIPEPSSVVLFVIGGLGLGYYIYKKQ